MTTVSKTQVLDELRRVKGPNLDGNIVAPTPYYINPAGFTIHSAIHAAREDALCVIHLHTDAGVGVSAQKDGLLPLTQNALLTLPNLAYHGYEGVALNLDERERLVKACVEKGGFWDGGSCGPPRFRPILRRDLQRS